MKFCDLVPWRSFLTGASYLMCWQLAVLVSSFFFFLFTTTTYLGVNPGNIIFAENKDKDKESTHIQHHHCHQTPVTRVEGRRAMSTMMANNNNTTNNAPTTSKPPVDADELFMKLSVP